MKLENIKKTYHNRNNVVEALKGITLDLHHNGIIMILGPSGCGKTTLLNIIAGRESYEGKIEDIPYFDYLTQKFNLFEEMTVWDNLYMIKNDEEKIKEYLEQFNMLEHASKKVKKLSNGQKKRVQFIRALLHQPGLLLCDEPTAALDHENTVHLMEELKRLSADIQILLVTHDIALAEEYADRIITMDQGIVVKDEIKAEKKLTQPGNDMEKHGLKETFVFALKELTSRLFDSVGNIILTSFCILTVFVLCNLYMNITSQSDYHTTFKNAENMIVSLPKHTERNTGETYSGYTIKYADLGINDLFDYTQIQTAIENIPEIIAVESFNSKQYQQDMELDYARRQYDIQAYHTFTYNEITLANSPFETPFMMRKDFQPYENWLEYLTGEYMSYSDYLVQVFDLVNGYEDLSLICGSYPAEDEVILSKNAADMLMELDGYHSYEEMIGQTMKLGIDGYLNEYYSEIEGVAPIDTLDVTISGVSSVENDFATLIFFNSGYGNNPIFDHYVVNKDALKFQYVRFLLKPGSDYEVIAQEIQTFFSKENVDIIQFQGKGLGKDQAFYQSPASFMIYGLVILLIIFIMMLMSEIFKRRRVMKEKMILHTYGYSIIQESFIRYGMILGVSCILVLLSVNPISTLINDFAAENYYQPFMTMNFLLILVIAVIVGCIMILLEAIVSGRKHYDNH